MRTDPHDVDALDDRLRTLVGRAVAEAPQAPDSVHVAGRGAELAADPRHHRGRSRRALVVGIAAAALALVATAVAVTRHDGGNRTVVSNPAGGGERFVLGSVPIGYRLAGWIDRGESFAAAVEDRSYVLPLPEVQVFERTADGVLVRFSRTAPAAGVTEDRDEEDDETWLRDRVVDQLDDGTFTVLGATAVRSGHLPVGDTRAHGTTFFLRHDGGLAEADAYGADLGDDEARALLDRFTVRGDGGIDPPDDGSFQEIGAVGSRDPEQADPPLTLAHWSSGAPGGIQVSSRGLRTGEGDHVLLATRDLGIGTVERWGDRTVLAHVDPGLGTASAAFVEGGRLVTVAGPTELIVSLVAQTEAVDTAAWRALVAEGVGDLQALPRVSSAEVGLARIEVYQAPGAAFPAGWCLTVDDDTACAVGMESWLGLGPDDGDPNAAVAFDVLVDGTWWAFGRGPVPPPGEPPVPLEVTARVDDGRWDRPTQVEVDGVAWWAGPVPEEATALFVDATAPDGSGIGHQAARPAS